MKRGMAKIILVALLFSWPLTSWAAEIYFIPAYLEVKENNTFIVDVLLNSDEKINAIDATVVWPADKLQWFAANKGGSVFDLWVKEPLPFPAGRLRLVAGSTQGFTGRGGKVVSLVFKAIAPAESIRLDFADDIKILLADGKATPAKVDKLSATFTVKQDKEEIIITSRNQPDQDRWYNNSTFDIHWPSQSGWEYSYIISRDQTIGPDDIPERDKLFDIEFKDLPDGIYYFHLRARPQGGEWGEKMTRRAQIDTTPPRSLTIRVSRDEFLPGKVKLVFAGIDDMSGIDHYEVRSPGGEWQKVSSPYIVPLSWFDQQWKVRAFDRAGNYLERKVVVQGRVGAAGLFWLAGILLLALIVYTLYRRRAK